jgi:hypothetical protein
MLELLLIFRYYSLSVSNFKSSLDTKLIEYLWSKYWAATLSESPLLLNQSYTTSQINDVAEKIKASQGRPLFSEGMAAPSTRVRKNTQGDDLNDVSAEL